MPAPDAGHLPSPKRSPGFAQAGGGTRPKPVPSPHLTQQDPAAPRQSRRKSIPPLAPRARSLPSSRPRNARKPTCHRQIPIDRTARTTEPDPPAVSSPEASRTPADRVRGTGPATAGVREPFTQAEVSDGHENVCFWGESGSQFRVAGCLFIAKSGSARTTTGCCSRSLFLLFLASASLATCCCGGDFSTKWRRTKTDAP